MSRKRGPKSMVWQNPAAAPIIKEPSRKLTLSQIAAGQGVPMYMRLQIPMRGDPRNFRYMADILRGLANSLDFQARIPDNDELKAIKSMWWEIKHANQRLADYLPDSQATKSGGDE